MSQFHGKDITAETIRPMLSRTDLQLILNISASGAKRLINALPHYDIAMPGAQYQYLRVRREDFDAWLKSREVNGHELK